MARLLGLFWTGSLMGGEAVGAGFQSQLEFSLCLAGRLESVLSAAAFRNVIDRRLIGRRLRLSGRRNMVESCLVGAGLCRIFGRGFRAFGKAAQIFAIAFHGRERHVQVFAVTFHGHEWPVQVFAMAIHGRVGPVPIFALAFHGHDGPVRIFAMAFHGRDWPVQIFVVAFHGVKGALFESVA